jgi:hypothetical protein
MLIDYLPRNTYAIAAAYEDGIVAIVAGAKIREDNRVKLIFPKVNPFHDNQRITLHLDNRTGVETFTPDLRVYRCSYKGVVTASTDHECEVMPREYDLRYSNYSVELFKAGDYQYPLDSRPAQPLKELSPGDAILPDLRERDNKLGVWITQGIEQPHTTVMAFLSSDKDDIFVVSHLGSFKSNLIHKNPNCCFAIDHRSSYVFEKSYDWNYTIIRGRALGIKQGSDLFREIQTMFVDKNPWELVFFTSPEMELFSIKPIEVMYPEKIIKRG